MKRIGKETFCDGNYENAVAIRIENGEFYFLGDMEEWPDCPEWNKYGRRIFAPYKSLELDRVLVSEGILDALEAPEYERTPMTYYYEEKETCESKSIYEAFVELIKPYERNGEISPDDYDIFVLNRDEFMDLYDALRDGDYIFILEDVNVETHTITGADYNQILKRAEKKEVCYLTIYDVGQGLAELIENNKDTIIIQWITFSPCYSCQTYDESFYTSPKKIIKDLIYSLEERPRMAEKEICSIREAWLREERKNPTWEV